MTKVEKLVGSAIAGAVALVAVLLLIYGIGKTNSIPCDFGSSFTLNRNCSIYIPKNV